MAVKNLVTDLSWVIGAGGRKEVRLCFDMECPVPAGILAEQEELFSCTNPAGIVPVEHSSIRDARLSIRAPAGG